MGIAQESEAGEKAAEQLKRANKYVEPRCTTTNPIRHPTVEGMTELRMKTILRAFAR
jgi:hypothetical protein